MNDSLPDEWTDEQNVTFMRLYRFMLANQSQMNHPRCIPMSAEHWQTVCHNAAYLAAEFLEHDDIRILDADTEALIAWSPQALDS